MKFYILDLDINNYDFSKKLSAVRDVKIQLFITHRLYTEKGIIEIDKSGKMWNIVISDDLEPTKYLFDGHIRVYIDKSTVKRKEEIYQIVPNHISVIINKHIYGWSNKSLIHFVVEEINGKVKDVYFESEVDIEQNSVKEDIATFLKYLNFIE